MAEGRLGGALHGVRDVALAGTPRIRRSRLEKVSVGLLEAGTPGTCFYARHCAGVFAEPKGHTGGNRGGERPGRTVAAHGRAPGALLFAPAANSLVKSFKLWHTDGQWENGERAAAGGLHACP